MKKNKADANHGEKLGRETGRFVRNTMEAAEMTAKDLTAFAREFTKGFNKEFRKKSGKK